MITLRRVHVFECTLIAMALASAADASTIDAVRGEDLFPESTFFVARASDIRGTMDDFAASPLMQMIGDGEDLDEMLMPMLEEMGRGMELGPNDVVLPEEVGLAAYITFDEDLGIEVPAYLLHISFGESEAMARAIFEQRMTEMTVDSNAKFDREEMRGREMLVIDAGIEMPGLDEFMDQDMMLPIGGDTDFMNDSLSTTYMVRDGARLLIGSEPIAIDDALSVIDGGKARVLADNDDYQALLDMIPDGGHDLNAMILTGGIQPMIAPVAGPMAGGILPIVQQLFGDIRGYGFWMDMGQDESVIEGGVSILVDGERLGLVKLLDVSTPVEDVPAFVPGGAVSYGRMDFDFKGLVPTIRDVLGNLPEGDAQQIEPMFEQFAPMLQSGLDTLGPQIHVFTVETDSPFTPTRTTIAIPTSNGEALEQVFAMLAPAAGLMPRDFNGDTIYSDPLDEFSQVAVGIGAGSLVIGQSDGVEAVLRSSGQKGLPQMEDSPAVQAVTDALPSGELMGWGVLDFVRQIEAQQAMAAMLPMLLGQAGIDPGAIQDEMERVMKMDEEAVAEMFGPGWWFMNSDDEGINFRVGVMAPGN